nr:hypothetical protein [Tanacetum cinerariifolium]
MFHNNSNMGSNDVGSANKYAVLSGEDNEELEMDPYIKNRLVVDEFVKKKLQPSVSETKEWTEDMIKYFKEAWEDMKKKGEVMSDEGDVLEDLNQAVNSIIADEVLVSGGGDLSVYGF